MVSRDPVVRVGFALGSWQVVALAAGLAEADARALPRRACEDHLDLYETVPVSAELKAAMHEIGAAVRPWRSIVDAFDLLASVRRRISQREFDQLLARLRAHLGLAHIDELWLCWLTRAPEKLVMEAWPDARVQIFEDGLFSYLPQRAAPAEPVGWRRGLRDWLDARRPVRRLRRHKSWLDPRHAARIEAAWMLLADLWPAPAAWSKVPWHVVSNEMFRTTLAGCAALPSVVAFRFEPSARPAFLVLGQTLSRWGALTRAEELAIYAGAVATAIERGYDVWWKEHPRAQEPFFADLAATAPPGRVRELALPFALPVELVAGRMGLAGCAAGISTAIFYLPRLYGIAAFTFADALAPFMTERWALQNELVLGSAPRLSSLPRAPSSTAPSP
ncbi:MAG: polysialyltransferase family glycosyltransferase [Caldimonas sp.]